jgi:hypothetical protein
LKLALGSGRTVRVVRRRRRGLARVLSRFIGVQRPKLLLMLVDTGAWGWRSQGSLRSNRLPQKSR